MTQPSGPQAPSDEPDDFEPPTTEEHRMRDAASWMSRVVARVPDPQRPPLPGIVSPLSFAADFAVNANAGIVSVTLGNGRVRLSGGGLGPSSGPLRMSLRWAEGFLAHGLVVDDVLDGGWRVVSVSDRGAEFTGPELASSAREVEVPTITILKTAEPDPTDEFTARVWGEAPECRGASIRGWSCTE
ncbi:hypothetical protein SCB71_15870 [Herbiconiux sp. KACC 21604]|uniref:hypothetical protein n=1 Tax=unclassified Herbiconiux TaxID=2618217 RepID=UPI00149303BA|nr:hypothetical protein [Herbiconiux sp. SALV-R1]QJU54597.1 hypothetical protein HL652_13820 [Herbiconiux sp. SALV-R1]WPO85683.1 hypothetical protein SCB71_15870 [Herbiconiux sp. KACC 21604]